MLNTRPIFIVAFQHGGSNIVVNLLRSHPRVCSPRGETQEVFMGKGFPRRLREPVSVVVSKLVRYLPILLEQRENVFSIDFWDKRKPFSQRTMVLVDRVLYREKLLARDDMQNRFVTEGVEYTDAEIIRSRTLCKNLNGLIALTDEFNRMYPDATFIALVRNGYALCEGHMRRGIPLERIACNYNKGCQQIISYSRTLSNFHVVRFEDLLERPPEVFSEILRHAGLAMSDIPKVRLSNKKVIGTDGTHRYLDEDRKDGLVWYPADTFASHFAADVNRQQIKRLSREQIAIIRSSAKESLDYFEYAAS